VTLPQREGEPARLLWLSTLTATRFRYTSALRDSRARRDLSELPFRIDWIQWLADHRVAPLTALALGFTFLGELEGYVALIALAFAAYDKRLAIRLAFVTLIATALDDFLKMWIANPRPFVSVGTYREEWAVPAWQISQLAGQYSTPSGHAMAAGAFWGLLYLYWRGRWARIACVVAILGTGLSRPYLGVHYVEDVLLGWMLGIGVAVAAARHGDAIAGRWRAIAPGRRVAIAVASSAALWALVHGPDANGHSYALADYAGFLTGIVAAGPLEERLVRFDPRSSSALCKVLRFALCVAMILGTLLLLGGAFGTIAAAATPLGDLLHYLRYAAASVAGLFVAPLLSVRFGLANRLGDPGPDRVPVVAPQ